MILNRYKIVLLGIGCWSFVSFGMVQNALAEGLSGQERTVINLSHARLGMPYALTLEGVGGVAPYQFELIKGSLPEGMWLSSQNKVMGDPGSMGSYRFTLHMSDSGEKEATQEFELVVDALAIARTEVAQEPMTYSAPNAESQTTFVPPAMIPTPPLPEGVPIFAQPLLLGTLAGGAPTLLP